VLKTLSSKDPEAFLLSILVDIVKAIAQLAEFIQRDAGELFEGGRVDVLVVACQVVSGLP
jgi:hypothetical protein